MERVETELRFAALGLDVLPLGQRGVQGTGETANVGTGEREGEEGDEEGEETDRLTTGILVLKSLV